jgi:hypothetical protein
MATITKTTLLDLIRAVSDFSDSDAEIVATVAYLVNSGKVRLCGNFAGAKIALSTDSRQNVNTTAPRRSLKKICRAPNPFITCP